MDASRGPLFHQAPSTARETANHWQNIGKTSGSLHRDFAHFANHNTFEDPASPSNCYETLTELTPNSEALDLDLGSWSPNPASIEPWACQPIGCHPQLTRSQESSQYLTPSYPPTIQGQVNNRMSTTSPYSNESATYLNKVPEYLSIVTQKGFPPPSSRSSLAPVPRYSDYISQRDFERMEASSHPMGLISNNMAAGGVTASVSKMIQWANASYGLPQTSPNNISPSSQYGLAFASDDVNLASFDQPMA